VRCWVSMPARTKRVALKQPEEEGGEPESGREEEVPQRHTSVCRWVIGPFIATPRLHTSRGVASFLLHFIHRASIPPNGSRKNQYSESLYCTCANRSANRKKSQLLQSSRQKFLGTPSLPPSATNTPSTMPLLAGQTMMSYKYLLYKSTTIVIPAAIALALPQPVAEPRRPRCEPTATSTTSSTGSQSCQPKS
jgi:hypothetical protein